MAAQIIGHRGAPFDAPENTLISLKTAFQQNADACELDVHLSKDGQIVVIHDDTTGRTAGPPNRKVAGLTAAELRELKIRWKDRGPEKIPLLEEVFPLIPSGRRVFIEVKIGPESIAPLKTLFLRTGADPASLVIIGFDIETMRQAKVDFPKIEVLWLAAPRRGAFTKPPVEDLIQTAKVAGLDGLDLEKSFPIDRGFVEKVHAAGLKLYTWVVDDPAVACMQCGASVDGITTNRPGWLREQLAAKR
jgi:glycerophosphoryl diester phosphodiesterase